MKKIFLMLQGNENLILGTSLEDDPDDGPIQPQAGHEPGVRLLRFDGEFTRAGRRDTEVAHLVDGQIVWTDTKSLETYRAEAIDAIDAAGEALRLAVINRMATQTEEYRRVEAQARAWREAGYPEDHTPRGVASWARAKYRAGWTNRRAADDILATADGWYDILDDIRDRRLMNKENVRHETDGAEIRAIVDDMRADMRMMAAELQLTITL